ncbi:transposase [soil metagenome]
MALHRTHSGWAHRGYLPHFDEPGLVQSITFRLADSLPAEKIEDWKDELTWQDDSSRLQMLQTWLDRGEGACWLRERPCAEAVRDALKFFHGQRYQLLVWCIMPNHVHVLVETMKGFPLGSVVHSWKIFTARAINRHLTRMGPVWQVDYFDRYIRSERHYGNEADYIEGNPVMAGFVESPGDWEFSSAWERVKGE